jgi:hypothetical protein
MLRHIRRQELAKYPPSRSLLALPLHRKILGWYVGRVVIWIEPDSVAEQLVGDRVTLTVLDTHSRLQTWSLEAPNDLMADRLALPEHVSDGPALLLVHEEESDMRDLRQLAVGGAAADAVLEVTRRRGTLVPARTGMWGELKGLGALRRRARANRHRLASWPHIEPTKEQSG